MKGRPSRRTVSYEPMKSLEMKSSGLNLKANDQSVSENSVLPSESEYAVGRMIAQAMKIAMSEAVPMRKRLLIK